MTKNNKTKNTAICISIVLAAITLLMMFFVNDLRGGKYGRYASLIWISLGVIHCMCIIFSMMLFFCQKSKNVNYTRLFIWVLNVLIWMTIIFFIVRGEYIRNKVIVFDANSRASSARIKHEGSVKKVARIWVGKKVYRIELSA